MKKIIIDIKKTMFRITLIVSVLGYIIVPFIHNHIDASIAKIIWYPSNLFVLVVVFSDFKREISKDNPMINVVSNIGVFWILPFLPSVFVFHYYNIDFIWKWVIFAYAFIVIPCSFLVLLSYQLKQDEYGKEEKAKMSLNMVKYIALFLLIDFLYMAIFNDFLIFIFIFGTLAIILSSFNLVDAFLHGFSNLRFFMVVEFLLGMGLAGYLIYIIPSEKLQNIVLTIFAALVGGAFTLLSVAWTIKKTDADRQKDLSRIELERKEEERKKLVPYMRIAFEKEMPPLVVNAKITEILDLDNKEERKKLKQNIYYSISIEDFKIKNISNTNIILDGVMINGMVYKFKQTEILEPNTLCLVQTTNNYRVAMASSWPSVSLVISDILGNKYEAKCTLSTVSNTSTYNLIQEIDGEKFAGYDCPYKITSIGLPMLTTEDSSDKEKCETI